MNRATVQRATAGLAAWLVDGGRAGGKVVVGHDARHGSAEFAADTAGGPRRVGARPRRLPDDRVPTPLVAFAVRALGAAAGVMVTASHNPACRQRLQGLRRRRRPDRAADGRRDRPADRPGHVGHHDRPRRRRRCATIPDDVIPDYIEAVVDLTVDRARDLRIAYTPMHGVGRDVVLRVLAAAGFPPPAVVERQADPDPDFPTLAFPNPEEPGAIDLLLDLARAERADVAIANDPDADRLAVAVPDATATGGWRLLTGDEIGALLGEWRLDHRRPGPPIDSWPRPSSARRCSPRSPPTSASSTRRPSPASSGWRGPPWPARTSAPSTPTRRPWVPASAGSCGTRTGSRAPWPSPSWPPTRTGQAPSRCSIASTTSTAATACTARPSARCAIDGPDALDRARAVVERLADRPARLPRRSAVVGRRRPARRRRRPAARPTWSASTSTGPASSSGRRAPNPSSRPTSRWSHPRRRRPSPGPRTPPTSRWQRS